MTLPLWFPERAQLQMPSFAPLPAIDGGWPCIEADPPWQHEIWGDPETEEQMAGARGGEKHYKVMTLDAIASLPVRDIAARDAHLWFWITSPLFVRGEHIPIMRSWGFEPSASGLVWIKLLKSLGAAQFQLMTIDDLMKLLIVHTGPGKTTRKNIEFCILGRRGSPKRLAKDVHEVIISPRREHSRKPVEAYDRISRYCPGPRLSLFSREPRKGWTVWGNETTKFGGAGHDAG